MSNKIYIARLEQIDDPGSFGFSAEVGADTIEGFIVHKDGEIHAYRNSCPHTGSPLDWVEHQFLDRDMAFIQCAVHDALFEVDSGLCISGPCPGESLQKLRVSCEQGDIYLEM